MSWWEVRGVGAVELEFRGNIWQRHRKKRQPTSPKKEVERARRPELGVVRLQSRNSCCTCSQVSPWQTRTDNRRPLV